MTTTEKELYDGALDIANELIKSEDDAHKSLGHVIRGLCAIIAKIELLQEIKELKC